MLVRKKCAFFLKVNAKNIAFDVGYWDLIRNGKPTRNIGGLCYCPCAKWFNNWTEQMCPSVTTDHLAWPCLEDKFMPTHYFEQHLFETMRDEPSGVYHSLIILYLIKVYPLANTLLQCNNINDFFVNYCFSTKFFMKFYGFNNNVITSHARLLDDQTSYLRTLEDPIRGQSINDKYMSTLKKLKKKKKSFTPNSGQTNKKKKVPTQNVIDSSCKKTTIVNLRHDTIDDSVICLHKDKTETESMFQYIFIQKEENSLE